MTRDSTFARIRQARHRISEERGHDPKRLVERYVRLQEERHADRLVRPATPPACHGTGRGPVMPEDGGPEAVLPLGDYLNYYDLDRYLFKQVRPRFHSEHSIGAFDFFSIVIWKANRAKSRIAERLWGKAQPGEDLDAIARRLTASLYGARDACERFRLLLDEKEWGFRLPMASAVLTVLWPDEFTVYDYRTCEQLQQALGAHCRIFKRIAPWAYSDRLWQTY